MAERSSTPRKNKHGVPVLAFTGARETCLWLRCARIVGKYSETNLCDHHAERVHRVVTTAREAELGPWTRQQREWAEIAEAARRRHNQHVAQDADVPTSAPVDGVIYYVKNGGHIKIGWTSNLTKRMRAYPPGCELMAVHDGTRSDERKLHQRFAVHRSHGREWYPLAPVILDHIKRMVAEHGAPDDVDFGARPVEVPQPRRKQFVAVRSRSGGSYGRAG